MTMVLQRPKPQAPPARRKTIPRIAWTSTFRLALLGGLILWAALPPLDLWPLAWVAPLPWLWLIRRPALPDRRPYLKLWLAGVVFWLLAVHWIRLPHPATYLGWFALAGYLGVYLPLFVGLGRVAVHQLRCPLALAAPVIWTGLEFARAHLLGGFLMAALGHTQYRWIGLIQISDLAGGYLVSFLIMLVAAGLAGLFPWRGWRGAFSMGAGVVALGLTLAYGAMRVAPSVAPPDAQVALIQGSIPADWKAEPGLREKILKEYATLSYQAAERSDSLDLIVWPETMFPNSLLELEDGFQTPPGAGASRASIEQYASEVRADLVDFANRLGAPLLIGIESRRLGKADSVIRNSAVFVPPGGPIAGRYDKMHLVMFGEYIPLARYIPALYKLTPLTGGLEPGSAPQAFESAGVVYAPNICYESVLPHLIRGQVDRLAAEGREPDVLVNLTNDAWFRGSSELDMHLVCSVFRAIECRRPVLIAANTGVSANIDGNGRILERGPRMRTDVILADVRLDGRPTLYRQIGDWPAGICLAICAVLGAIGAWPAVARRIRRKSPQAEESARSLNPAQPWGASAKQ